MDRYRLGIQDIRKPPRKGLHIGTKILLFAAAVVFVLQVLLYTLGGQNNLCVYFWLYPLLFAVDIVLLVALIIPGARRITKTVMSRKLLTAVACMIVAVVAVIGWSVVWAFYSIGNQPVAYYTSPSGGHRLVVMRHYDMTESVENPASVYEAYPMVNSLYYAYQESGQISDPIKPNPPLAVEWQDDAHARVYRSDMAEDAAEIFVSFDP